MPHRLEIRLRSEIKDPEGEIVAQKARTYFHIPVDGVRVVRVLTIDKAFGPEELHTIQKEIFTNPVTEESSFEPISREFDQLIWVGLRPGVKDNQGSTAVEAIEDLLGIRFKRDEGVYFSKIYELKGKLTKAQAELIARELLANELIQRWRVYSREEWDPKRGIGFIIPKVKISKEPGFEFIPIDSDQTLLRISFERNLALNPRDVPVIRQYFMRPEILEERRPLGLGLPTDVEIEYISQARSDHCNHNTFKGLFRYRDLSTGESVIVDNLFKTCIEEPTLSIQKKKDWVISVLWDNAGVAKFDEDYYYTITGETHNSPSNMEAYGGALTGIVGVYRDPLGTGKGSRLIMGLYGFCVGPRDYAGELRPHLHPRRLLDGVIEGVRDGGNKHGVPTPYGILLFDESYLGKCLVYVTALGIMPAKVQGQPSHLKTTSDGDLIVMCGGRVGKDGIHGVTAASEAYSEHTPAGHVQIGDPYTQKKMHDFLLEARDLGIVQFITDNGGGGLSSSIGESARFSNGARVDLDKVPLKYDGLDCWEIWVSESQERMTVAIRPEDRDKFMELSRLH
ncbi:MAG: phosphoribosylformylglycinamidine synthase subunit PurS, partial [Desulfatiglandales bacterium]